LIPIVSPTSLLFDVDDKAISGETSRTYARILSFHRDAHVQQTQLTLI
jgi:hypothetical protein